MNLPIETVKWFYYPVIRQGKRFVEAPESDLMGVDRPIVPELEAYLKKHHESINAIVEISGKSYSAEVFEAKEEDDLSYVIADSQGIPPDVERSDIIPNEHIAPYLMRLEEKLAYSEAISPGQSSYLETEFMTPTFSEIEESGHKSTASRTWNEVTHKSRVVLLGEPGIGKTTCLRKLALELSIKSSQSHSDQLIPVYVQLRNWLQDTEVLENARRQVLRQDAPHISSQFESLASIGKILLILDGLDELPDQARQAAKRSILSTANEYPRLSIFVSTRKAGYDWRLPGFDHFEINPYPSSTAMEWAYHRIFLDSRSSWRAYSSHLNNSPELLELAANPMWLTMATYLYQHWSLTPQNKATLMANYADALLETWDSVRGVRRNLEQWAAPSMKVASLCRAALALRQSNKNIFNAADFLRWQRDHVEPEVANKMLLALIRDTGILRMSKVGETESFSFVHDAFTEYFAARCIVERTDDIGETLLARLESNKWQDVWLLACGLTPDASHLIELLLANRDLPSTKKATLMARAFSQSLNVSTKALELGSKLITDSLEEALKGFKVNKLKGRDISLVWSALFAGSNISMTSAQLLESGSLLRSVYLARRGAASKLLYDALSKSRVEAVSHFSTSLEHDGLFEQDVSTDTKDLSIGVMIKQQAPSE